MLSAIQLVFPFILLYMTYLLTWFTPGSHSVAGVDV